MRITNKTGLPAGLVRAIERDPYDHGSSDITASQLPEPPQLIALRRLHDAQLQEDASERVWSLFGQALHVVAQRGAALLNPPPEADPSLRAIHLISSTVVEAAALAASGVLAEQRYFAEVGGWRLSGQLDHHDLASGVLSDYKCTSAWTIVYGDRIKDWTAQLNTLAYLLEQNGIAVKALEVVALLRDWSERDKARVGPKYPTANVVTIPLDLWPAEQREAWIIERVKLHQASRRGESIPCTDEERWAKRERDGSTRYVRCERYCPVGRGGFCPQWQQK